jgi:LysR family glycine cleavage system transcriptional activator
MATLRTTLPPINSLVVFEAAARHLNFTRAAGELGVSQAAVSRQVQLLEAHLGAALFERARRRLHLTDDGAAFQRAVNLGLEHIARAAVEIRKAHTSGVVTVSASVTFASYWLMTRLMRFRAANPDIELRLIAASPIRDLGAAGIDLAIRYGAGVWPDADATLLLDNEIWPVCSPRYLQDRAPPRVAADLLNETLLRLARPDRHWVTWDKWFEALGVTGEIARPSVFFDNYLVLLQAALRGEGVALCGARLAEDFVERGELVNPHSARSAPSICSAAATRL